MQTRKSAWYFGLVLGFAGACASDATPQPAVNAASSDAVARGQYIVEHVAACGDCHTPRDAGGRPIASQLLAGNPAFLDLVPGDDTQGLLPAPNLTPDAATGLGGWTDAQIKNAFLNGLDKDEKPLVSVMPYYVFHNMSDADADAVVAFLRSLPSVNQAIPERQELGFPVLQAAAISADAVPHSTLETSDPNYASAANGRYLAGMIGICMECHTEHESMGPSPLKLDKLFAGNEPFQSAALGLPPVFPATIVSSNVTPATSGLAGWTAEDVVKTLKMGVSKDGVALCPPMPFGPNGAFGGLTDQDALDIGRYLTSLPPIDNVAIPLCAAPTGGPSGP